MGLYALETVVGWLDRLFNQHKLVRRIGVIGVFALIAFATIVIFSSLGDISMPVASAYGTLCALLAVVFKFYADSRAGDK